ncbi:type II toxin-antitoxin system Phd/YefM family antitoxin [Spirosoma aerophilum]
MEVSELYKVSAQEARVQLSDLINKAIYGRQPSLITRQGKPAAVLISFEQWQAFQQVQKSELLPLSNEASSSTEDAVIVEQEPKTDGGQEQQPGPVPNP